MKSAFFAVFAAAVAVALAAGQALAQEETAGQEKEQMVKPSQDANPRVKLTTTKGDIIVELNREKAPITVENFLTYVREGYYDGLVFHRVIPNFMIQAGGFDIDLNRRKKGVHEPIKLESKNGLSNERGTIAMARTADPNSATTEFFINVVDNPNLDYPSRDGHGYAVFGKVVEGMDVVDAIRNSKLVTSPNDPGRGREGAVNPDPPVVIEKATIVDAQGKPIEQKEQPEKRAEPKSEDTGGDE